METAAAVSKTTSVQGAALSSDIREFSMLDVTESAEEDEKWTLFGVSAGLHEQYGNLSCVTIISI